jgi:hypothetical protein
VLACRWRWGWGVRVWCAYLLPSRVRGLPLACTNPRDGEARGGCRRSRGPGRVQRVPLTWPSFHWQTPPCSASPLSLFPFDRSNVCTVPAYAPSFAPCTTVPLPRPTYLHLTASTSPSRPRARPPWLNYVDYIWIPSFVPSLRNTCLVHVCT